MACRPGEIQMVREGGLRGTVARRTLLGDTLDYRVTVGPQEVRVIQSVRKPHYAEGDPCRLKFSRMHWYAE